MDKDLIEDNIYQIIDQFNEKKLLTFCSVLLNKIHPFYDGNVRTAKILFANNEETMKLIDEEESIKTMKRQKKLN